MSAPTELELAARQVVGSISSGVRRRVEKARPHYALGPGRPYIHDFERPVQIPMRDFVALVEAVEAGR